MSGCKCYPPARKVAPWDFGYMNPPHAPMCYDRACWDAYQERYDKWYAGYKEAMIQQSAFIRKEIEAQANLPVCDRCKMIGGPT